MAKEFIVYSGNNCKYCALAKMFITNNGGTVDERNVDNSVTAFEEHAKTGAMGVPVLVHKATGTTIIGFGNDQVQQVAELLHGGN